jgi:hypothetical protein
MHQYKPDIPITLEYEGWEDRRLVWESSSSPKSEIHISNEQELLELIGNKTKEKQNKMKIVKYIRKNRTEISPRKKVVMKRTHKIGTLVAYANNRNIPMVGWSLVNTKDGDVFDPIVGQNEALKRAIPLSTLSGVVWSLPLKVRKELPAFVSQLNKYFKTDICLTDA